MKTILVPTDFSKIAANAAEYAANLAKEIKAKVCLFHVYDVPVPVSTEVPIMVLTPEDVQKKSESLLQEEARRLKKKTGIEVHYSAKMGIPVDEIMKEEKKADLIVMGIKGAGKLSELLVGSTTTATFRKSKKAVLVIPEKFKYKKPEKIAFACDYDPRIGIHTLDTLKDFMRLFNPKVYVLNIKRKKESVTIKKTTGNEPGNELNAVEHLFYFSEKDDLVDGINEFAEGHHIDMLAIIPHHHNLLEGLFHKSISKKMAFHTHIPLLTLPDNHKTMAVYL